MTQHTLSMTPVAQRCAKRELTFLKKKSREKFKRKSLQLMEAAEHQLALIPAPRNLARR